MKIGILGGTFDPPHLAHKEIALRAIKQFKLDKVVFIPSGTPWQKSVSTPYRDRFNMTRILIQKEEMLEISDIENNTTKPTYTIDTLRNLCTPENDYFFILGSDAAIGIKTWKSYKEMSSFVNFLIAPREEVSFIRLFFAFPFKFKLIKGKKLDISSTSIRNSIQGKERSYNQLIPKGILDYINREKLY